MDSITERVTAGAAFQDEHDPDWWRTDVERAIDLDTLWLGSGDRCILGQRCPLDAQEKRPENWMSPYCTQATILAGLAAEDRALDEWAAGRGFQAGEDSDVYDDSNGEYDDLTAAWRDLITKRRENAGVPA